MYFAVKSPKAYRSNCGTNYQNKAQARQPKQDASRPKVNIVEGEDYYRILLATPGIAKDAIKVKLEEEVLTISTEIKSALQEGEKYNHREFKVDGFSRDFSLPDTADTERIEAKVENGILAVTIFKKAEATKQAPRKIDIV